MYSIDSKQKNADYRYTISKTTQARGITHGPNHVKENIDIKVQNGGKVSTLFKMFTLINDLTLNL